MLQICDFSGSGFTWSTKTSSYVITVPIICGKSERLLSNYLHRIDPWMCKILKPCNTCGGILLFLSMLLIFNIGSLPFFNNWKSPALPCSIQNVEKYRPNLTMRYSTVLSDPTTSTNYKYFCLARKRMNEAIDKSFISKLFCFQKFSLSTIIHYYFFLIRLVNSCRLALSFLNRCCSCTCIDIKFWGTTQLMLRENQRKINFLGRASDNS